jgi:hypothetical protein
MKLFLLSLLFCLSSCSPQSPYAGVEKGAEVRIELPPTSSNFDGGLSRNSQQGFVLKVSKGGVLIQHRSGTETFIPWSAVISVRIITPAPR